MVDGFVNNCGGETSCVIIFLLIQLSHSTLYFLFRNRHRLSKSRTVKFRYGLFFVGYRTERWYWEGVVALRKVILVCLGAFGGLNGVDFLAHWALFILGAISL